VGTARRVSKRATLVQENKPSNMLSNLLLDLLICFHNVLSLYIVTQWSRMLHLLDNFA